MYQHKCESICTCDCFTVCYDSWRFTGFLFSMLPSSTSTHSSAIIQIILYPRACVAHGRVHYANCIFIPYTYRVFFLSYSARLTLGAPPPYPQWWSLFFGLSFLSPSDPHVSITYSILGRLGVRASRGIYCIDVASLSVISVLNYRQIRPSLRQILSYFIDLISNCEVPDKDIRS